MQGKKRKTIRESCPDCGNKVLELRVVESIKSQIGDETIYDENEFLYCNRCEYETVYRDKKKRKPVRI